MKKFLLLFLIFGVYLSTSAQTIDIDGIGMVDQGSQTLTFTDPGNITDVSVGAIFKGIRDRGAGAPYYDTPKGTVEFEGVAGDWMGWKTIVDKDPVTGDNNNLGYWKKELAGPFNSATAEVTNPLDEPYVLSFYAFIYRKFDINDTYKSFESRETVFFFRNGDGVPAGSGGYYQYEVDIDELTEDTDIKVKIPISGLSHTGPLGREADIAIYAKEGTSDPTEIFSSVIYNNNKGVTFTIIEASIEDVPSGTEKILVRLWSPIDDGESFFTNGVVVDVEKVYDGCTLTQGYWKTHGFDAKPKKFDETWNNLKDVPFFSSGLDYYGAINEKAKGNAYYILAHQYVAAKLNFLAGADPAEALDAFNDATALFTGTDPEDIKKLKGDDPLRQQFITAAGILDDYNNGIIGPGHCDDKSTYAEIDTSSDTELNIYPNPMSTSGTIDFTVANEDQTTVEMYNLMGQKVATLFDQPTQADQKYQIRIDANRYQKGLYVIYLKNGSSTFTKKVNIN